MVEYPIADPEIKGLKPAIALHKVKMGEEEPDLCVKQSRLKLYLDF